MKDFLTHVHDWLMAGGPSLPAGEWLFLLLLLLAAAVVFNIVTDTSDPAHMAGNFLSLLAGAILGGLLFPDWAPPLDASANLTFALFSGMTATALINMALLRSL